MSVRQRKSSGLSGGKSPFGYGRDSGLGYDQRSGYDETHVGAGAGDEP